MVDLEKKRLKYDGPITNTFRLSKFKSLIVIQYLSAHTNKAYDRFSAQESRDYFRNYSYLHYTLDAARNGTYLTF